MCPLIDVHHFRSTGTAYTCPRTDFHAIESSVVDTVEAISTTLTSVMSLDSPMIDVCLTQVCCALSLRIPTPYKTE